MALFKRGLPRLLFIVIVVICVLVVSLNIFLNIKLGKRVPLYLEKFSEQTGFGIEVDDANLDPLFRLKLSGIKVSDPSGAGTPPAEIKSVILEPRILSSLVSGRVNLGRIVIKRPVIRYDRESADKLLGLFKGSGREGEGERTSPSVGIERIRLEDARFELSPDFSFLSESAEILIVDGRSGGADEARLAGNITALDHVLDFRGTVNMLPGETKGMLEIALGDLDSDLFPEWFNVPGDITGASELTFQISEGIKLGGGITFKADSKRIEAPFADIRYELRYDSAENTAYLDTLAFELMDAFHGSFSGTVKDVTGEMNFNITGRAAAENLKDIVKWFPDINENELSGSVKGDNLKIEGSRKNNDIGLKGEIALDRVNFADKNDRIKAKSLNCRLNIKENFSVNDGFSVSSLGGCSMDTFFWDEIGELNRVSGNVEIKPKAGRESYGIVLSGLDGRYMDGRVGGSFEIIPGEGETEILGKLEGENLNLEKTPKNIVPLNINGNAQKASAKFGGKAGNYNADISFVLKDFLVRSKAGREFVLSNAETGEPLRFEFISAEGDENGGDSVPDKQRTIKVTDSGLFYEGLSFDEYFIKSGTVDQLDFSMNHGGGWALSMTSGGRGFEVRGKEISLERFREHLDIENSGREGFSGTIAGEGGRFKGVEFPTLSAEYEFRGDFIDIRKLAAGVGTIGEFTTDKFNVQFGKSTGGYPYKVVFEEGRFEGFDGKLQSRGIGGSFILNGPESGGKEWEGDVKIANTDIVSQPLTNLSFGAVPSPGGIELIDVSGDFQGGKLSGKVDILTSEPETHIVTKLALQDASTTSGALGVNMGRSDMYFSGTLPNDSLPEGTGKLKFDNLRINKEGAESTLNVAVNIHTSGETLFIDEGFIRNRDSGEMKFSGEMKDSLKENRSLELDFPEFPISDAVKFFSPFMPAALRDSKTDGVLSLHVEFSNLFAEDSSWKGNISLKNASFKSYIGGADLSVRDIDGEVRIKDKGKFENTLASLMGQELDLNKQVYRKYQRFFKEAPSDGDLDLLKIGEIEYGILKFEDLECALEVDREKINLIRLVSAFFAGKLYATGLLRFDGGNVDYNFSLLFNDISLEGISKRLSSIRDYITGRVNGLIWLTGEGGDLGTIDGPFEFWSVKSSKEARVIGRALLNQLGARERFVLGSTRSYDKGEISGYINDGVITFKTLEISNRVLGFRNLSIQADPIRNSISIAHLVSVIREIARRSQSGGPTIETN